MSETGRNIKPDDAAPTIRSGSIVFNGLSLHLVYVCRLMCPPLPESLSYLNQFVAYLSSLSGEALNEDVDSRLLDETLRVRLATDDSGNVLENDVQILEDWLAGFDSSTHPANWIVGYLSNVLPEDFVRTVQPAAHESPDAEMEETVSGVEVLANCIRASDQKLTTSPVVSIDMPDGWKGHMGQGISELRCGKSRCTITVINEQMFNLMYRQLSAAAQGCDPVQFGMHVGHKFRYPGAEINNVSDYLLKLNGGYVRIRLLLSLALEDDKCVEACFHSLKLRADSASQQ